MAGAFAARHCSLGRIPMTTTGVVIGQLSEAEHSRQLRRAIVASTVGTIIEAYDFLLYVLVAPLVFAKLYFPESDPLVGVLQAFAIYAVGFIARPVGAALKPTAYIPKACNIPTNGSDSGKYRFA